jgi:hypothetical protein
MWLEAAQRSLMGLARVKGRDKVPEKVVSMLD